MMALGTLIYSFGRKLQTLAFFKSCFFSFSETFLPLQLIRVRRIVVSFILHVFFCLPSRGESKCCDVVKKRKSPYSPGI